MSLEAGVRPVDGGVTRGPGRFRRIDHIGVVVHDIDAAAHAWAPGLGFRLAHVADVLDGTVRLAYLDIGDTTLQLVQPLAPGALAEWLAAHGEGLHHICLEVDAIPAALDGLDDRGARFIYRGGRGSDVCFLGEPRCGVLVELTEPSTIVGSQPSPAELGDPA
jgi:methylmalonyl-CoA epimerase